jgi:hypothetical protein
VTTRRLGSRRSGVIGGFTAHVRVPGPALIDLVDELEDHAGLRVDEHLANHDASVALIDGHTPSQARRGALGRLDVGVDHQVGAPGSSGRSHESEVCMRDTDGCRERRLRRDHEVGRDRHGA